MSENKKLVPKRRFKEFQNADAWEECELGEVVFVNSGRDYKHLSVGNIPVYGTGGYMLSVNNKLSDEDAVGIGRKGSIDNPQYLRAPFWTVDTLFFLTPKEEMNLRFFYAMAQGIKWRQFDESTGVPSLSKVNIEKITKNFPKIEEQEIIGQFFKNLDQTIAFQQRKLEKMKSMKSAYLSEMFPAEGERKPKRRFPGFTDDWDQRELGELASHRGGTAIEKYFSGNGKYKVISIGSYGLDSKYVDQNIRAISNNITKERIVNKGELAMVLNDKTSNGSIIGRSLLIDTDDEYVINQRTEIISPNENLNSSFAYVVLNGLFREKVKKIVQGGTQIYVNYPAVEKMTLPLPNIDEQKALGEFFNTLDQTIAFQQQKLEKLQNIKKAYLNELFI
ncbi:restriction endonuclease subunit S [Lactococcus lactis]|uniref:restriction endonuclease subunit S n=1 Tax=Lactococcus lactis TaxID=1358 RepID=UPI00050D2DEB|nr:restriction endonuclease subunit S [Lactococcus lactis]AIS03687.1 Type I restriction-modification system, S subunit [Lactococcus lactis]RHJ30094.1 restriction endonuclease subunit S [Lactococcus lactis]